MYVLLVLKSSCVSCPRECCSWLSLDSSWQCSGHSNVPAAFCLLQACRELAPRGSSYCYLTPVKHKRAFVVLKVNGAACEWGQSPLTVKYSHKMPLALSDALLCTATSKVSILA